jgi:hypothetical protein
LKVAFFQLRYDSAVPIILNPALRFLEYFGYVKIAMAGLKSVEVNEKGSV